MVTSRTVGAVVADELIGAGINTGFGVVGEGNLDVVYELVHRHGLKWLPCRREDGGVAMADGYARRGGGLGFAAVTHGPALTNALTALIEARKADTALLLLTGEFPDSQRTHPQWIPQRALLESIGLDVVTVSESRTAAMQTREAVAHAINDRQPTVLSVRTDLVSSPAGDTGDRPTPLGCSIAHRGVPDLRELRRVAKMLGAARRPVVVAGAGVMAASAGHTVAELADRTGALLGTTLRGNGLFAGHPWNLGVIGGFAWPTTERLVRDADLVLVLGASLNDYTTDHGRAFGDAEVVRVDVLSTPPDPKCTVALTVTGDARDVTIALAERLTERRDSGYRTSAVAEALREDRSAPLQDGEHLDANAVSTLLDRQLPVDRTVCTDLGYFTSEVAINVAVRSPERFVFPVNSGSVGLGLATAIGAAHARPETLTLAALGDGGLAMSLQELETLARTRARVLVVVYNDSAYGVEYHALRDQGRDVNLSKFDDVDFATVARSLGIPSETAKTQNEATAAVEKLLPLDGPALIDAKVDGTVRTRWYEHLPRQGHEEEPA